MREVREQRSDGLEPGVGVREEQALTGGVQRGWAKEADRPDISLMLHYSVPALLH